LLGWNIASLSLWERVGEISLVRQARKIQVLAIIETVTSQFLPLLMLRRIPDRLRAEAHIKVVVAVGAQALTPTLSQRERELKLYHYSKFRLPP
jgi:hypothetical protein